MTLSEKMIKDRQSLVQEITERMNKAGVSLTKDQKERLDKWSNPSEI